MPTRWSDAENLVCVYYLKEYRELVKKLVYGEKTEKKQRFVEQIKNNHVEILKDRTIDGLVQHMDYLDELTNGSKNTDVDKDTFMYGIIKDNKM